MSSNLTPREVKLKQALLVAYRRGIDVGQGRKWGHSPNAEPTDADAIEWFSAIENRPHNVEDATIPSDESLLHAAVGDFGAIIDHLATDRPRQADLEGVRRRAQQGRGRIETVIERNSNASTD